MSSRQDGPGAGELFSAHGEGHGEEAITAYCDGGSRGNPGPAGFGVFIQGPDGEALGELSEYLGKKTNNFAEYSGLLAALDFAITHRHPHLKVVSDSELMVKQIKGQYRVNSPDLRPLYDEAKRRIAQLKKFQIQHVLREKNQRADRLANLAMDRGMGRSTDSGTGRASDQAAPRSPGPGNPPTRTAPNGHAPEKIMRGLVKGGVIHLFEGELPEGTRVKVTLDRG